MVRHRRTVRAYVVAPGIEARPSILHAHYTAGEHLDGWDTVAAGTGISTAVLARSFLAGDSVEDIAAAFAMYPSACEAALRWEALSRRVRVARVRRAVLGLE